MAGPGMLSLSRTEKYCTKLANEVMKLRNEKALVDFKLHVKDDEFPCAKFIMAAHSPMLRAMLTSDMAEVAKQEIRLDHISKDIVQIILDYMYCEDVSFHKDQLMDLIAAADYLQMTELKEMCLNEVPDILEPCNVIDWWQEATKMNYDAIKEPCEKLMAANFKRISHQTDFLNLDLNEIQHYVSDICSDSVNSDQIVDGLMRWTHQEDERVSYLEDLLNKRQLNKCSAEGLKYAMDTYETLLDKTQTGYKLLSKTLADIAVGISKTVTDVFVVIGGEDNEMVASKECWQVSPSPVVEHLCNIPVNDLAAMFSVCKIPQGFIITGGMGSCLCMMFNAATKSWVKLQNLKEHRCTHGSVCVKGVLYVLGGLLGNSRAPSNSVHTMMMKDCDWQNGLDIPLAVNYPEVSDMDEDIYLLDTQGSSKLFHLNIGENNWNELAPIPVQGTKCGGVSMTSARGQLFVTGGQCMICAWYKPKSNTWHTGQQPLRKHRYGALSYHDDRLLLLGGSFKDGTDEVEEYNIDEDKWSVCSLKMPRKINGHHAFVLNMQPRD